MRLKYKLNIMVFYMGNNKVPLLICDDFYKPSCRLFEVQDGLYVILKIKSYTYRCIVEDIADNVKLRVFIIILFTISFLIRYKLIDTGFNS